MGAVENKSNENRKSENEKDRKAMDVEKSVVDCEEYVTIKAEKLERGQGINLNPRVVRETFKFTNLIKNIDFQAIAQNIEGYLGSDETHEEKLRVALLILKEIANEENKGNLMVEKFFALVEKHYQKIYEAFEKRNKSYKPLIKLLQILDLILENLKDDKGRKEEVSDGICAFLIKNKMLSNLSDWRFLRKLCEHRDNQNLEIDPSWRNALVQGFRKRIEKTNKALIWMNESEGVKYAKETIAAVLSLSPEVLYISLLSGRFDKEIFGSKRSFSMVLGDEGGLFLLINSVPPGSRAEKCILEAGVSAEFIKEKRDKISNKIVLGQGAFGKVRLALSIFGNRNLDIGQLVCVKKSLRIGEAFSKANKTNTLRNTMDSIFEDFMARKLNDCIHSPTILDMAINNKASAERHMKGYLMMEVYPENTADKIFQDKKYQKWEYQKPYILAVMKTTRDLLFKDRVFNSDLKPANTLFDPLSRKMAIIDLGSSILISKDQNIEEFDASNGGFGISKLYCPPEIIEDKLEKLNLNKAISYLCAITAAVVVCGPSEVKKAEQNIDDWNLTVENTDLDKPSRKSFAETIKQLADKDPVGRLDLSEAIEKIEKIGLKADEIMRKASSEQYIEKVRKILRENKSSLLSLNDDIMEVKKKGIIEQLVVENNPKRYKHQKTKELNKDLADFVENAKDDESLLVLLGEAGSGKSLGLQLRFIKEVLEWEYGKKALPIFFNMADEVDLVKVINRLNAVLGCNIKLEEPNDEIHLFIDSYDEGRPVDVKDKTEEKDKESEKETSTIIEQYLEKLKKWKKRIIVISCRTDFVQKDGDENLAEFQARNMKSLGVRYIAPIAYEAARKWWDKKSDFSSHIKEWLKREGVKDSPEDILRKLKRLGVEERMRTGMMFEMIMKMVLSIKNQESLSDIRLKGFEIYRGTIREEFKANWKKVVCRGASEKQNLKEEKEVTLIIKQEIENRLEVDDGEKLKDDDSEMIWEGMERIGELLATEMSLKRSNRVRYDELERLLRRNRKNGGEFDSDERTEWNTLYQILRIMGLKLERRNGIITNNANKNEEALRKNLDEEEETLIDIGFRHETYKNYYLVRGLKRLLPVVMTEMMSEKAWREKTNSETDEATAGSRIVAALLEDEGVISNFELLRFCGEEILNYKDARLREGLRNLLYLEQELEKQRKVRMKEEKFEVSKLQEPDEKKKKVSRAAVIMSLLVAGSYQFIGEDLSDLDLTGANLRGGDFFRAKFERTKLREASLRHADVSEACFVEADLRGLQLGVWPDLIGHTEYLASVCFSPDGKRVASGSGDKSVKIWDALSGECMQTLLGHTSEVISVCFDPEGNKIASGSQDKSVKIWDTLSGECLLTLLGHTSYVDTVCFSPDGKNVASGARDKTVKIWNVISGECVQTLFGGIERVHSVCFSPDGKKVASAYGSLGSQLTPSSESVKIWDPWSAECLQMLKGHNGDVLSVCFSPDGKRLASGGRDNSVKIWDVLSGECLQTLLGHSSGVISVCFSPDGKRVASGSWDNSVKIWDALNGECLQTLFGHFKEVAKVCFSPDMKRIASVFRNEVKSVKVWDAFSGECVQRLLGHYFSVKLMRFSPDEKRLASLAYGEKSVKIWDTLSWECVHTLLSHSENVSTMCFSPDGKRIASGGEDKLVKIWDVLTGECVQTYFGHNSNVDSVCFSPDGKKLASTGQEDKSVKIWDASSGRCVHTLKGHKDLVSWACFSPEGKRVVSCSRDNSVKIWDALSGECVHTLLGNCNGLNTMCFSPDGKRLVLGGEKNSVKIWDALSGKCLKTLLGHTSYVNTVSFSPDGNLVASGCYNDSVRIWDALSGECIQTLLGKKGMICLLCFSPEGKRVAAWTSSTMENSVKIWDALSGKCLETFDRFKHLDIVFKAEKKEERGEVVTTLERRLGKSGEEPFRCDSCVLRDCLIENPSLERVILQRKGKIIKNE